MLPAINNVFSIRNVIRPRYYPSPVPDGWLALFSLLPPARPHRSLDKPGAHAAPPGLMDAPTFPVADAAATFSPAPPGLQTKRSLAVTTPAGDRENESSRQ